MEGTGVVERSVLLEDETLFEASVGNNNVVGPVIGGFVLGSFADEEEVTRDPCMALNIDHRRKPATTAMLVYLLLILHLNCIQELTAF